MARPVSIAAGTILDVDPASAVDVAVNAGFDGVGLWFDPDTWTAATTAKVAQRLDAQPIVAVDIEPVILGREPHDFGERLIDLAAELDVPNLLIASGAVAHDDVRRRLATLSTRAADTAPNLTLALEFLPIFSVRSFADAATIVRDVDAPNVGVLIDTLHFDRSGSSLDDLAAFPDVRLPYLQLADAGPHRPTDLHGLRIEALDGRLLPGDGVLPLVELLRAVPDVPVSVELRSAALLDAHPDPDERARAVHSATMAVLAAAT